MNLYDGIMRVKHDGLGVKQKFILHHIIDCEVCTDSNQFIADEFVMSRSLVEKSIKGMADSRIIKVKSHNTVYGGVREITPNWPVIESLMNI